MVLADLQPTLVNGDIDEPTLNALARASQEGGAVDVETTGLDVSRDRIEVISVAAPGHTVVVCTTDRRPHRLLTLLADPDLDKIFHHALFDTALIYRTWGVMPRPQLCTKVAARIAGVSVNPTLADLVQTYLDIELDKSEQTSDWSRRPLSDEQVNYAAADVVHLHALIRELLWSIADRGRTELFRDCMDFLPTRARLELDGLSDVFAYYVDDVEA